MLALLKAYQKMDPSAKSRLEVLFLYPGVKALLLHRMARIFYKMKIPFLPRMITEIARWMTGIEIHPGASIGVDVIIDHGMGIVIGETAIVGNRVLIYHGVTLGGTQLIKGKRHPTIEDDVILGAGCKILGNIVVGKNSKIGANSVVISNIPENCTAVGIPARVIPKNSKSYKEWALDYQI